MLSYSEYQKQISREAIQKLQQIQLDAQKAQDELNKQMFKQLSGTPTNIVIKTFDKSTGKFLINTENFRESEPVFEYCNI